ncbi:S-layer homology domain-containing protein [Ureibacillus composti]|nr:S-layer homology domain-containing protein [Ureibacillus composti]
MANLQTKYKKFVATAATATLVASAIVPVASAATPSFSDIAGNDHENNIKELAELGFIGGYTDGTFKPGNSVTRGQVALMLGKWAQAEGVEVPADYATKAYFNDVPASATEDNKKMYALVKAAGIFEGSNGSLNPGQEISRQHMAVVLNSAFKAVYGKSLVEVAGDTSDVSVGDIEKVSADYRDEVLALKALGITKPANFNPTGKVTRGQFASFLNATIKVDADVEVATAVTAVNAINAKTIEVEFNNAIDKETINAITLVAGKDALDAGTVTKELSEDGKTLTLKAEKIFKGEYTVGVPFETVKDVNGEFVSPTNSKVTVDDQTAPVLTAATSTIKDTKDGVKSITLTFDEEVKSIDTVKINGTNYSASVHGNEATVTVDLDATKSYDVTVVNATDFAGNVKEVQVASLNVTIDDVAPSIVDVKAVGENQVKVTVDDVLANDFAVSAKVGTFNANIVTKVEKTDEKEYTVTLNKDYLYKNGNSDKVTLTVAKDVLVDALGNKNAEEITKTVVVSKDVTAPEVVKVETSKTDGKVSSFAVSYDEEVVNPTLADVKVVNSKGEILSASNVVSKVEVKADDAKTVVFTLPANLTNDNYSFELAKGFVVDKALTPNESAKYSFDVNVTEDGQPVETSFNIAGVEVAENVITVDFGTKVKATGTGSALNPSAYQLNGDTLPSNTEIAFAKDNGATVQSKVVITLPAGFVKANDDKAMFRVNAVQSLDDKVSNQFSKLIAVTDNTAPVAQSFVATDLTKITVTYSEAIKVKDTADVELLDEVKDEISLVDSKGAAIAITAVEVTEDGELVLTVADANQVASLVTLETQTANITDVNGVAQETKVTVKK